MTETYTITEATEKKRLPAKGDYKEKIIWELQLAEQMTPVELFQNAETAPPEGTIEGTIEPGKYGGLVLRKPKDGSYAPSKGSDTWKPRDPLETKRIVHQHAQKVAVSFLQIRAYNKEQIKLLAIQDVFKLATLIREDVEKVQ